MTDFRVYKLLEDFEEFKKGDYTLKRHINFGYNKKFQEVTEWGEILREVNEDILNKILFDKTYMNLLNLLVPKNVLKIKNRIFENNFNLNKLTKNKILKLIQFEKCTFKPEFNLENIPSDLEIEIDNCKFESSIRIKDNIESLFIKNNSYIKYLYFETWSILIKTFIIESSQIEYLKCLNKCKFNFFS
ncbi:MAG: hypothetical protein LAT82_03935, partial [Nanoarchaeota archaeon]|nr:hypothetical protein [Nanoarchaeota archaeon]